MASPQELAQDAWRAEVQRRLAAGLDPQTGFAPGSPDDLSAKARNMEARLPNPGRVAEQSNVVPIRGVDVRPPSANALERLGDAFGGPRPGAPAPAPPADAQGGAGAVPAPAAASAPAPAGRPADPSGWFGVPVWVWLLGAAAVAAFLLWRMQPKRRRR